jgi:thioredoxin 1
MEFTKDNFKQEVEDNQGIVLVDFFAQWCGPCQLMQPVMEELISQNKDHNVKIGKLNVDKAQDIASKYTVMSIPAFLLFKKGKEVSRIQGYCSKEDLTQLIEKYK